MASRKNPRVVSSLKKMNSNQNPHLQAHSGNNNVIFVNGVGRPEDGGLSGGESMSPNGWVKYPSESSMPAACASAPPSYPSNYQNQFYADDLVTSQQNMRCNSANFNSPLNNSMFYPPENSVQSSCFYQQHQHQNFLYDQQTPMKSCELSSGNNGNFYGGGEPFYTNNVHYQNQEEYHNNEVNYSQQNRHYNVGQHGNNGNSQSYFNRSYGQGGFNQGPLRRNSIESFSSEPGDAYQGKYGNSQQQYLVPPNTSVVKREHATTPSFNRRSNHGSSGMNVGYFFGSGSANSCSQARGFENFHHEPHENFESFKSCSFEQESMKMDGNEEVNHHHQHSHHKAGSVKQRSLSLSCSYPRNDPQFPNESAVNPFEINTNVINPTLPIVPDNMAVNSNLGSKIPDLAPSGQSIKSESEADDDRDEEEEEEDRLVIESDIPSTDQMEASTSRMSSSSSSEFLNLNLNFSPKIENEDKSEIVEHSSEESSECQEVKLEVTKSEDELNYELISTTTTDIKKEETLNECSNSSDSLANFPEMVEKNNIITDLNSLAISISEAEDSLSCCSFSNDKTFDPSSTNSPQKISKRSFSEADKDLVINTSAITAITAAVTAFGTMAASSSLTSIRVPAGWKRQITPIPSTSNNSKMAIYISPSGTKLKSLEELKNYICSDGTCKCGLSCPLRLEHSFSFDPKVVNSCEDEENQVDFNEFQDLKCAKMDSSTGTTQLHCNHKRKIPKSEDSPLISSTRDDLGDSGDGTRSPKMKKRKTCSPNSMAMESENGTLLEKNGQNALTVPLPKISPLTSSSVMVPFSQQSPDTTTQTPQTEMSPVSSLSSEVSTVHFRTQGGTRSASSTPTPSSTPNRGKSTTPPLGVSGQVGFAWPTTPSSQSSQVWSSPSGSSEGSSPNNDEKKSQPANQKVRKVGQQSPNMDLRPSEPSRAQNLIQQVQLPQKQQTNRITLPIGASQLNQNSNPNLSFFPISTTLSGDGDLSSPITSMNLNTGYSISPIPSTNATRMNPGTFQFVNLNANNLPLQRVVTMTNPANTLIHQSLPSSITISMVGAGAGTGTLQNLQPGINENVISVSGAGPTPALTITVKEPDGKNTGEPPVGSGDAVKSPLQLVQDVVDRFQTSKDSEDKKKLSEEMNESEVGESPNASPSFLSNKTPVVVSKSESPKREEDKSDAVAVTSICLTPFSTSVPIMAAGSTSTTSTVSITSSPTSLLTVSQPTTSMVIQTSQNDQGTTNQFITTSANTTNSIRYPIFQTIQPFFLNSAGGPGSQLIISPSQHSQGDPNVQQTSQHQSFSIYEPPGAHHGAEGLQLQQTMVLDSSLCGVAGGGGKKKKKRLSKKQQQQQAQMQLQQQLLLQSLQQQAQQQQAAAAAAAASIPLTIFPQSFNLGPQGFSLQPMNMNMNFFPTPTILTLPNLILNPADGTLFIQPSAPALNTTPGSQTGTLTGQTMKLGQFPITTTATIAPIQNHIAPKKESTTSAMMSTEGMKSSDLGSDDSRQNATPDSSTNDCQLNGNGGQQIFCSNAPIVTQIPTQITLSLANKKMSLSKSKAVSSSSNAIGKRVFTQKQILPKIDSTTPSVENG